MKNQLKLFLIALSVFALSAASCNKDEGDSKPEVVIAELGHNNSKTVSAGSELHMDIEIFAQNKIQIVKLSIHKDGNAGATAWVFEQVYTDLEGQKNADFHKDIDVDAQAETGSYHFQITVTDMEGYETVVEDELEITAAQL